MISFLRSIRGPAFGSQYLFAFSFLSTRLMVLSTLLSISLGLFLWQLCPFQPPLKGGTRSLVIVVDIILFIALEQKICALKRASVLVHSFFNGGICDCIFTCFDENLS